MIVRAYVAGPMTSIQDLNFPLFAQVTAALRQRGIDAVSPAEICPDKGMAWHDCMRRDIAALVTCDAIVMLPGWENSKGATLERHIAERLGMTICTAEQLMPSVFARAA